MKKILFIIIFVLSGCTFKENIDAETSLYEDGSYTTTADGYGGDFDVTTTIENDQIVDIVVSSHNETPSIGGIAIESLIDSMIENNGTQVDIISGATKTSTALIEAVNATLNNAKKDTNS
ncbi:MAG: FMN-binding protein [Erysipelotrichaceae bacterium]|nr:FMN-binding protein [Erysipelotrichaceae bacterium]